MELGTHAAPRSQKTASAELSLYEEDLEGARPDRLHGVRPQEGVLRHAVRHIFDVLALVQLSESWESVPVPQMAAQLVDDLEALVLQSMDTGEEVELFSKSSYNAASVTTRGGWEDWAMPRCFMHKQTVGFMLREEGTMKVVANFCVDGVASYCQLKPVEPFAGSEKCRFLLSMTVPMEFRRLND